MSKKNIIKLNKQYFSCNPINENFDDVPVINAETEPIVIGDNISSEDKYEKVSIDTEPKTNDEPVVMSNEKGSSKRGSKRGSRRRSKRGSKRRSRRSSRRRSKKGSKRSSRRRSKKGSKKRSKKRSKKSKEGFCAGKTCITESDLKNIINLLKNLELKKK
jgi:hypothetical protein